MKPLRLFYHVSCNPPAYLDNYLLQRGYPYEAICLSNGTTVPQDLDSVSGLVFMGGPGNVNEPTDWMQQEMLMIQNAVQMNLPVMGICLGAQLISKALGGKISRGESLEVGWHAVHQLDGHNLGWFDGLPSSFEVFQWHEHAFSLPPGATPLAGGKCFELQAFSLDNILAMQFHLEMTQAMIESLIERYASDLEQASECVHSVESIRSDLHQRTQRLERVADKVYDRWMNKVKSRL